MGKKIKKIVFVIAFLCITLFLPEMSYAANTGQETKIQLIDGYVGRYKLNYAGNTNHYARWNNSGTAPIGNDNYIYNDVPGYINSSTAALDRTSGASGIKYAYLVWETRTPQGATSPVIFYTADGKGYPIYPTYAINDWRDSGNGSWAYQTMYCMATDVTSIVKSAGYGNYSVCNIPRYNGGTGGGESPGSWQLIVVEEGDAFPVRVVSLSMGSEFRASGLTASKNYSGDLNLTSGLKSKAAGIATGQIMFGASNAANNVPLTEQVTTYNSSGGYAGQAVANTTYSAGLYRNAQLFNGRDSSAGCIRMDLSDVSNIGNSASRIHLEVENSSWTSFFLLGAALDIAYPDFSGQQTTTVNSSTSATVTGRFTNTAPIQNTGIYNGNLTVNLDTGLNPTSATAVVNGTTTISGSVSGHTVTFSGPAVASMMNGSTISYTVQCSTSNSGKTVFHNSAGFHGYLRSDGVNTGYWIDKMWTAASSAAPKYTLTINGGTGIQTATGSGDYPYGATVKPTVTLKPGYHWESWTGTYNSGQQDFTFTMPAGNVTLTANGAANTYTIAFHPNGGEGHMDSITATYDVPFTLTANGFTRENEYGASVFTGWNTIPETFEHIYEDGEQMLNLTTENNATITLYAIWDDCPGIIAAERYFTLTEAKAGAVTEEELFATAEGFDREDDELDPGEGLEILDFYPEEYTNLDCEADFEVAYKATDSIGNTYLKRIYVHIIDDAPEDSNRVVYTRFISKDFFRNPDGSLVAPEKGGPDEYSRFRTDPEYTAVLDTVFGNEKTGVEKRTVSVGSNQMEVEIAGSGEWNTLDSQWVFTPEDIEASKKFVEEHGFANYLEEDGLQKWLQEFAHCRKK